MQDKVNPLCICGCGVENTCHFLLQCLNFLAEKNTHVNRITSKGKYGPELTPYLDIYYAVKLFFVLSNFTGFLYFVRNILSGIEGITKKIYIE